MRLPNDVPLTQGTMAKRSFASSQALAQLFAQTLAVSIDKAMDVSLEKQEQRGQHVFKIAVVQGKPFYGFSVGEEVYFKIYLFNPNQVSRVCNLLRSGAIMGRKFQPLEAHIPYLLQVLIDYNLYGMGYIHLGKALFRAPLPAFQHLHKHIAVAYDERASWTPISPSRSPFSKLKQTRFVRENIDRNLVSAVPKMSRCELEVDASVYNILNTQLLSYTPLESKSSTSLIQSLACLWEEERERCHLQQTSTDHLIPTRFLPRERPPVTNTREHVSLVESLVELERELNRKSAASSSTSTTSSTTSSSSSATSPSYPSRPRKSQVPSKTGEKVSLCFSVRQGSQYPDTPLSNNPFLQFESLVEHLADLMELEKDSPVASSSSSRPSSAFNASQNQGTVMPEVDEHIVSQVLTFFHDLFLFLSITDHIFLVFFQ